MSICAPCTKLKTISKCTDEIIIGTMPEAETGYTVYFKNLATGKIVFFSNESDADNLLTIAPVYGFFLSENQAYEVWATLEGNQIEERVEIQADGWTAYDDPTTCFAISFIRAYKSNEQANENYDSQTFQLA